MIVKLTKTAIDAMKPDGVDHFAWDTELKGFGLKLSHGGAKAFIVQWKVGRRTRRYTIGTFGSPWTVDTARTEAKSLLGRVADGEDPQAVKVAQRKSDTVKELADRFLREHVDAKLKSAYEVRRQVQGIILPRLGALRVADVEPHHIQKIHHALADTPYQANRVMATLGKMFKLADRWGLRPTGVTPVRIDKFTERSRRRYLSADELERLGKALRWAEKGGEDVYATAAIRLLLYTGCRLGEALHLRWDAVDLERGVLRLADSKTGQKDVQLATPAIALLRGLPRVATTSLVFPGRRTTPRRDIKGPWAVIRAKAKLDDFRLHDLRHTFASAGVNAGLSLPLMGGLLGHASPQTTARYAHLAADPLKVAAERIGEQLAAALSGRKR